MELKIKKEIFGVIFLSLSTFLFISLFSYNPLDPSLSFLSTSAGKASNLCGIVGAIVSELFFQLFGLTAFIISLFLLISSFFFFLAKESSFSIFRTFKCFIFFLANSTLLTNIFGTGSSPFRTVSYGGGAGKIIYEAALSLFNSTGAFIFSSTFFIILLILATNRSLSSFWHNIKSLKEKLKTREIIKEEREKRSTVLKDIKEKEISIEPEIFTPKPAEAALFTQQRLKFSTLKNYELPSLSLLNKVEKGDLKLNRETLITQSKILEKKLLDFGIEGEVTGVYPGPVVTLYEYSPAPGIKISKITSLSDDLALAMRAQSIRIVAPIPGKGAIGFEISNINREKVFLREIIESQSYQGGGWHLPLAFGKDISGIPYVTELTKMPHLLVAGTTGSGKSVSLNSMIISLLFRLTPENLKIIMIDPKMLELSHYEGLPHLFYPVITDVKEASMALKGVVAEMNRRYKLLSEKGAKNIDTYNRRISEDIRKTHRQLKEETLKTNEELIELDNEVKDDSTYEKLPYLVVIIDELADLMMVAGKDVEWSITRLAQMARASGIHLILATQRPSVDVITGIIKANFSTRISFQVSSRIDSRTILDTNGAEHLLGSGDMLFLLPGTSKLTRIHGAYISEDEIGKVVNFWKAQGTPSYKEDLLIENGIENGTDDDTVKDEMYDEAVAIVAELQQASVSLIQRKLRIGYNRAARIIEKMEEDGIVSKGDGSKPREVLINKKGW